MSGNAGKDLLLKVEDSPGAGTYTTLGGLRSKTFEMSATVIESTNHGSNQYKEILDGAGIRAFTMSGEGIYNSAATLTLVETACLDQTLTRFQIVDATSGGRTYTGLFKIASVSREASFDAEQTYSISLESSGSITIT